MVGFFLIDDDAPDADADANADADGGDMLMPVLMLMLGFFFWGVEGCSRPS